MLHDRVASADVAIVGHVAGGSAISWTTSTILDVAAFFFGSDGATQLDIEIVLAEQRREFVLCDQYIVFGDDADKPPSVTTFRRQT